MTDYGHNYMINMSTIHHLTWKKKGGGLKETGYFQFTRFQLERAFAPSKQIPVSVNISIFSQAIRNGLILTSQNTFYKWFCFIFNVPDS